MKPLEKFVYSTCLHPVKVSVYNHVTHQVEMRDVPCGKCLHCRMTRVSEWVTRMICESQMYKHVYYITLTYDSKVLAQRPSIAADTHAVVHSFNQFHRPQLAPLTLCKRHTQLFWKRLRKNNPDISFAYYLCGEYGHNFGRPHYHAVIWSDDIITPDMILNAWQHLCTRDALAFEDLKSAKSSNRVYSYVCKYLFKDFKFKDLPTYRLHRQCYDSLYVSELDHLYRSSGLDDFSNELNNYEKVSDFLENLLDYKETRAVFSRDEENFKDTHTFDGWYAKAYNPFSTCSRKRSIGSRYVQKYLSEYRKGNLRIFGIHGEHLIFPQFFTRKAKKSLCPFAPISPASGKPNSVTSIVNILSYVSDTQDSLKDLYAAFSMDYDDRTIHNKASAVCARLKGHFFNGLDFYDYETHTYYMYVKDRVSHGYALARYNRHTNQYHVFDWLSLYDVIEYLQVFYDALYDTFLKPFEVAHQLSMKSKADFIAKYFHDEEDFNDYLHQTYALIQKNREIKQTQYKLTKQRF